MPLAQINKNVICTSPLTELMTKDDKGTCSSTPRVSIGGGMETTIGNLWPLVRLFLEKRSRGNNFQINMTLNTILLNDYKDFVDDHFALNIDLQQSDDIEAVVQTMCYTTQKYMVLEKTSDGAPVSIIHSARTAACVQPMVYVLRLTFRSKTTMI